VLPSIKIRALVSARHEYVANRALVQAPFRCTLSACRMGRKLTSRFLARSRLSGDATASRGWMSLHAGNSHFSDHIDARVSAPGIVIKTLGELSESGDRNCTTGWISGWREDVPSARTFTAWVTGIFFNAAVPAAAERRTGGASADRNNERACWRTIRTISICQAGLTELSTSYRKKGIALTLGAERSICPAYGAPTIHRRTSRTADRVLSIVFP